MSTNHSPDFYGIRDPALAYYRVQKLRMRTPADPRWVVHCPACISRVRRSCSTIREMADWAREHSALVAEVGHHADTVEAWEEVQRWQRRRQDGVTVVHTSA